MYLPQLLQTPICVDLKSSVSILKSKSSEPELVAINLDNVYQQISNIELMFAVKIAFDFL